MQSELKPLITNAHIMAALNESIGAIIREARAEGHAAGTTEERAATVAWLRGCDVVNADPHYALPLTHSRAPELAKRIEAGTHLAGKGGE